MAGHIPTALSVDWCTEDRICDALAEMFGGPVDLDPCSNPYSRVQAKVAFTLEKGNDGLVDPWDGESVFCNPPFGKGWWKPREHDLLCGFAENRPTCVCGALGRRDYIWPSDRTAAAARFSKRDFRTWIKPYRLASIGDWIQRCARYGEDRSVVGLLPCYPGTKAWQKHVWPRARAILFPSGRLHFRLVYLQPDGSTVEKTGPAPMDCALPLWTHSLRAVERFRQVFGRLGHVQMVNPVALMMPADVDALRIDDDS